MPSGDIEEAMKEYSIDYCAASFDELYSVLKNGRPFRRHKKIKKNIHRPMDVFLYEGFTGKT